VRLFHGFLLRCDVADVFTSITHFISHPFHFSFFISIFHFHIGGMINQQIPKCIVKLLRRSVSRRWTLHFGNGVQPPVRLFHGFLLRCDVADVFTPYPFSEPK
ncbi:hypothetical protein TSAR_014499, partial [Trichomalopsis sarcophagae]